MSTEVARPGNKSLMHSYLQLLLKEIYRDIKLNDSSKTVFFKNDLINKFSQLLSENFSSKRKPSEYAKLLGVTPNYLNRICKEELNCTAGDLIREKLISESKQLLAYTSLSITEIAEKLGFENTSYFVTMFKREVQITPEQFRKRSRETDTN
jgi:AraC-like DNA-binding protein